MIHHDMPFSSDDGLPMHAEAWLPEDGGKAVVALVHGFVEHSGRHRRTAEALVGRGYAVYAMDLRGHGRSGGPRLFVDRFDRYLEDLDLWIETVRQREAGKPMFLLGHSMGGLIAALWSITRRPPLGDCPNFRVSENGTVPLIAAPLAGLVLSASALRVQADLFPTLRHVAGLAGRLLPRLRLVRLGFQNISRDSAVVAAFQADPLVFHGRFPIRTGAEILAAIRRADEGAPTLRLPLLVMQGTGDRLCDPEGSREFCRRAGSSDKTLRLYDGLYHDIFSEPEREQVLADLIAWLDARR